MQKCPKCVYLSMYTTNVSMLRPLPLPFYYVLFKNQCNEKFGWTINYTICTNDNTKILHMIYLTLYSEDTTHILMTLRLSIENEKMFFNVDLSSFAI